MVEGLYGAARSMHMRSRNIEVIANNIANIHTTGYKRELPFTEFLDRQTGQMQLTQLTDLSSGNLTKTDNPLDLALEGNGFFMIETERGIELTRNGKFTLSQEGTLVDQDGNPVLTTNGELNLEETMFENGDKLVINADGEILIGKDLIGKLSIAKIESQEGMHRMKGQRFYFEEGVHSMAENEDFNLHQGFLEESNSNAIVEMQTMIRLNKGYESSSKIVTAIDQIMAQRKEIGKV